MQGALEASQRLIREANVLRAESAALAVLTSREQEVFWGVVAGMSNKVIASELGISEKTVKVHRHNLMRKVGHSSVADLVRMGERIKSAQISPNRTATLVRIGD